MATTKAKTKTVSKAKTAIKAPVAKKGSKKKAPAMNARTSSTVRAKAAPKTTAKKR